MNNRSTLLASATLFSLVSPSLAQQPARQPGRYGGAHGAAAAPAADIADEYGDEEIVVTGARPRLRRRRYSAENTLDSRDVRATGATNITDLLEALAPQIGSARGRGGERRCCF